MHVALPCKCTTYRDSCKKYIDAVDTANSNYYSTKIAAIDQIHLFQMISGLFTVKPERPLPSHTSFLCLTESFNNYFTTKILNLRDNLVEINNTSLSVLVSSTFSSFTQVSVSYIQELIAKSKPRVLSIMTKIPEISIGIQMERSVSVSSDRNIRDHLWRWSTYFGWNIPIEMRRSIFEKPVLCPN